MHTRNLAEGSLPRVMAAFALPYLLSYLLQILYGLADLWFIGLYGTVADTTAVSIGSQVMHGLTVMVVGLAMGTTVVLARAVGGRDEQRARRVVGNTVSLFLGLAVVLAAVLALCVGGVTSAMSTPAEAVCGTRSYLLICFVGIPAIVAYNVLASVFRGLGDTRTPMLVVAAACAVNVALDWLLIGRLDMGPAGAALATTLSQGLSVGLAVACLHWARRGASGTAFSLQASDFRPHRSTLSALLRVGVPISLQDGFIQVSFLLITVIANLRGLTDAAAVGIVEKIIGVLFLIPSAMLSTVSAVSAQCLGAGRVERARQTLWLSIGVTVVLGSASAAAMQWWGGEAVGLFTADGDVVRMGFQYLRGYSWDCVAAGIHFCFSGFFCACSLSLISFAHNACSITLARVPLAYLASVMFPATLYPMGLATVSGSVLSVLICLGAYLWISRHGRIR